METNIAVFRGKEIRKTIHMNEWWFSIIDVIEVLTGSDRPRKYWSDLKNGMIVEGYIEVSEKIGQLKMIAPDGKMRLTDCAKLGEAATTEITRVQDAQGFDENRTTARKGGRIAGDAREKLEKETSKKVVTHENYLKLSQKEKKRLPKPNKLLTE